MRYIRTEEGFVFETRNDDPFTIVDGYMDFFKLGIKCKIKGEADDLEELCDCFVDHCEEDDSYLVSADKPIRTHGHEIYGAVWRKFGLWFVAKMNGKGEFELI